jgi:thiosulfate/3-mercaptopyruvate sulfurtransferase
LSAFTTLIEPADLAAGIAAQQFHVVDTRFRLGDPAAGKQAYREGHIPGAVYLHLERDLSGAVTGKSGRHPLPDPGILAARLGRAGICNDDQVVVYDDAAGAIAARLWWLLRWIGHSKVAVLNGGLAAWLDAGHGLQCDAARIRPKHFIPGPGSVRAVSTEELLGHRGPAPTVIIDARERSRFLGHAEPIDARAGRIPGATSFPYSDNLQKSGRMLKRAELRRRWRGVLGDTPATRVACMCGSGVTACLNLLAMELAGLPGAALYAGSWSEWIRDPERPIARGER